MLVQLAGDQVNIGTAIRFIVIKRYNNNDDDCDCDSDDNNSCCNAGRVLGKHCDSVTSNGNTRYKNYSDDDDDDDDDDDPPFRKNLRGVW